MCMTADANATVDIPITSERSSGAGPDLALLRAHTRGYKSCGWCSETAGEFIRGFRGLHFVGPCITVFGSARWSEGHPLLSDRTGPRRADRPVWDSR